MSESLNFLKQRKLVRKQLFVWALISLVPAAAAAAQGSVWNAYFEVANKFVEDKDYLKAEKLLVEAVAEAEKRKNAHELMKSLKLLHKVYLAIDKERQASNIEQKIESLGGRASTEDIRGAAQELSNSRTGIKVSGGDTVSETPPPETKPSAPGEFTIETPATKRHHKRESDTLDSAEKPDAAGKEAKGLFRESEPEKQKIASAATGSSASETSESPSDRETPKLASRTTGVPGEDSLVKKAKEALQLVGHNGWTKSLDVSPDGTKVLSGSVDNTMRLWDVKSGKEVGKFEGTDDDVSCVAFSPTGTQALSGGGDNNVRLWDLEAGTEIRKLQGHSNIITAVAFAPGGGRAASSSYDGTIRIWDLTTGKQVKQLEGKLGTVRCIAFTPDGDQLVSGGSDKILTLWNLRDGSAVRRYVGHKAEISTVAVSRDGSEILSSSRDLTMKLWDLLSGEQLKDMSGHANWIVKAKFLSSDRAISGGLDKTIRIWDLDEGKEVKTFPLRNFGMWSLAFSDDGNFCVTGSDDFSLRVWDIEP